MEIQPAIILGPCSPRLKFPFGRVTCSHLSCWLSAPPSSHYLLPPFAPSSPAMCQASAERTSRNQESLCSTRMIEEDEIVRQRKTCCSRSSSSSTIDTTTSTLSLEDLDIDDDCSQGKRKLTVTFLESDDVRVVCNREVLANREALWYGESEYHAISQETQSTVSLMNQGATSVENDFLTTRGLENAMTARALHRRLEVTCAIEAVLDEQDRLRSLGYTSLDFLSDVYAPYSRRSAKRAHRMGLRDQEVLN